VNARDLLDRGLTALGLFGDPPDRAAALAEFRRASEADPEMCDAWLGRAAAGDATITTLARAVQTRTTLHRETRRHGLDDEALRPEIPGPVGYLDLYPTTPGGLQLAYAMALITAGDYAAAETVLNKLDLRYEPPTSRPTTERLHTFVGVTLHYVTQRWTDVVTWATQPGGAPTPAIDNSLELLLGIAYTSLGQFQAATKILAPLTQRDRILPVIAAEAWFYQGLCQRKSGDENGARQSFQNATINGTIIAGAQEALADPTYGPRVTTAAAIAARTDKWNPKSGPTQADIEQARKQEAAQKVLAEADEELKRLVGLTSVKSHVVELKNVQRYDQIMAQRSGGLVGQSQGPLHVVLVGAPGTAKTSIARILGKMYYGLGLLSSSRFREVKRHDLVGKHIGDTEDKTTKILNDIAGGVLFIDEAYTLYQEDNERDFGRVALDTIMTFAEDHRRDTMLCLAGYVTPMNELFSANPGMRGRFPHTLQFSSYTPEELVEIADLFAQTYQVTVTDDARSYLTELVKSLCSTLAADAGFHEKDTEGFTLADRLNNGRFIRNVLDKSTDKMKNRLALDETIDLTTADLDMLRTVTLEDLGAAATELLESANIALPQHLRFH
jgi:type VII secretion ATPase EccA